MEVKNYYFKFDDEINKLKQQLKHIFVKNNFAFRCFSTWKIL